MSENVYTFNATTITGEPVSLGDYRGKVLLIVNTASKCGFTPQYKGLENLHNTYKDQGLVVLGFPCNQFMEQEPGSEADIQKFCELNYGVSFQMLSKIDVNGSNAHPLYAYLTDTLKGVLGTKKIKWNFTKFLVNRLGQPVKRFSPNTEPEKLKDDIETLLAEQI